MMKRPSRGAGWANVAVGFVLTLVAAGLVGLGCDEVGGSSVQTAGASQATTTVQTGVTFQTIPAVATSEVVQTTLTVRSPATTEAIAAVDRFPAMSAEGRMGYIDESGAVIWSLGE
jgi:hypothetical protein